jgi:hypothetical protein
MSSAAMSCSSTSSSSSASASTADSRKRKEPASEEQTSAIEESDEETKEHLEKKRKGQHPEYSSADKKALPIEKKICINCVTKTLQQTYPDAVKA